ncbi:cellulase family glycosylhydrolase [Ruminococcus sp.]|uniref:cellulase family glycosylhydrolase n=1 Tax=Ruminococcus sp. TaxID=41978 RepID=UPI0025FD3E3B|nr:cellulase family glycosylhydrolase [Ruminococcus sp.]MBQ8966743.1 cellulase family glycosylhydrolase [Ruminococcus sp.]
MRAYLRKILSFAAAGAMTLSAVPVTIAQAKDVSEMTPFEIAADMGVGWNLGNTLDAHDGGSHRKMGLESEKYWGNPYATKELIDEVKAKGFKTFRVPVTWYPHVDASYNIDTAWMNRVKEVVDWCIDEDTYVILNIHHEEWNTPTDANYDAASAELKAFWSQIAEEFKDYDRHLIFEGMNEPRNYGGAHEWDGGTAEMREVVNKLDQDFVDTVRATGGNNKTRCLMVPTYAASSTSVAMNALKVPDDPNMLVSVHCYTPYNFAMNIYGTKTFDSNQEKDLDYVLNDINNIFIKKGHAVVVGEFGASNKQNDEERGKWAAAFAKKAKAMGMPIVIWDNGQETDINNTGDGYGLINRYTYKWNTPAVPLVENLISTYYGTPMPEPVPTPAPDPSEGEVIYSGSLSASEWTPSAAVPFDFPAMEEGSAIAVTYDSKGTVPTLIVQDDDPYKVWAKVTPYLTDGGVAYYSYDDIAASYAAGYDSAYGKAPAKTLDKAFQLFLSAENVGSVTASKVEYLPPAADEPEVKKPDISQCTITLSENSFVYDGTEHKPAVTVTYGDKTLTEGTDYTLEYKGGTEVGEASVTVTAKGDDYTGGRKVTYSIEPADIKGYKLGDVNLDGDINVTDLTLSAAYVKGIRSLSDNRLKAADVNEDGDVNVSDVVSLAAHVKSIRNLPDKTIA